MLERTDAVTKEVLEPIRFVLVYTAVFISFLPSSRPYSFSVFNQYT